MMPLLEACSVRVLYHGGHLEGSVPSSSDGKAGYQ